MVRRPVWSENLKNDEAVGPRWDAVPQGKKSLEQAHLIYGFWYFVFLIVYFNTSCRKYAIRIHPVVYLWNILNKH